jgi:nitrate/TMAO reductase-like tetraheme cytochrome c subunit
MRSFVQYLELLGLVVVAALGQGCSRVEPPVDPAVDRNPVSLPEAPFVESPQVPDDRPYIKRPAEFVGSDRCKTCHERAYASWHDSYHRTMTALPTPENVKGNFDGQTEQGNGMTCQLSKDDEGFYGKVSDGKNVFDLEVSLLTGSHHMQMYWFPSGKMRELGILPVVYLVEADRWIPRDSVFLEPAAHVPGFHPMEWSTICIRCHTTQPNPALTWPEDMPVGEVTAMDTHVGEFGIACESCHGPASEHAAWHQTHEGAKRDDDSVVLPTSLPSDRMSDICGKCHGISLMDQAKYRDWYTHGRSIRPGMTLAEGGYVLWDQVGNKDHPAVKASNAEPGKAEMYFWGDGMVRVSGREFSGMIHSPCYRDGKDAQRLTCMSCHAMHQPKKDPRPRKEWANDQLKPRMTGNQACLQCHSSYEDATEFAAHTHHAADSSGSTCYNCHMPYTTYGLLKTIRSHTISSPRVQETLAFGRPNACNLCHLDKTLAWTASHLHQWYGIDQPALSPEEQAVPASLIALFSGDAGQRAIIASSMGREDARTISGDHWLPRALMEVLNDPYHAVRYVAQHSLQRDPHYADMAYDFLDEQSERRLATRNLKAQWGMRSPPAGTRLDELVDFSVPGVATNVLYQLRARRDDRVVILAE